MTETLTAPPSQRPVSDDLWPRPHAPVTDDTDDLPPGLYAPLPDISHLVTEDDTPVDNILSEKQQRLLTTPLYDSWQPGRAFIAASNVGIFRSIHHPAVVPDMFLSLDTHAEARLFPKENRSYFLWVHGKPPEIAVEIVSNKRGGEIQVKRNHYAAMRVQYYIVFDPECQIQDDVLTVHELIGQSYERRDNGRFDDLGLGLILWSGTFEKSTAEWLRWCDLDGNLILTGDERAHRETQRAERLAAKLRELGVDPTQI